MSTFTASQLNSGVKRQYTGVQAISCIYTASATGTASSVFKLVKIPNRCTVVDYTWYMSDAGTNNTYKLGLRTPHSDTWTLSESQLSTSHSSTAGQTHRAGTGKLPFHVSFSNDVHATDGDGTYAWIEAKTVTAISGSALHKFTVFVVMDDDQG